MVEGHASTYFDDWVSFPFVPGHEVVGELDDGTRVVLEPVLGHEARGFAPPFEGAAPGDGDDYAHLATGHLEPGIQTGFCCSTGGGWAPEFVAHETQLHRIADDMPDERAVLVEPLAGGIHAALMAGRSTAVSDAAEPVVAVLGAGTMGLAADRRAACATCPTSASSSAPATRTSSALARPLGAHDVVPAGRAGPRRAPDRRLPRRRRPPVVAAPTPRSTPSATRRRVADAPAHHPAPRPRRADGHAGRGHARPHRAVAPRDRARRRLHVRHRDAPRRHARARTFDLAIETADAIEAERWLSATYRLADHVDAIAHAAAAGRRGAVKIAFDLRRGEPLTCPAPDSSSTSTARRRRPCSGTARASASRSCPPTAAG